MKPFNISSYFPLQCGKVPVKFFLITNKFLFEEKNPSSSLQLIQLHQLTFIY